MARGERRRRLPRRRAERGGALRAAASAFEASGGLEPTPALPLVAADADEESFARWCSSANVGHARDGSPVYLERTGATAAVLRELLGAVASQRVLDRHVRQQELAMARCEEATALLGAPVTKQLVVMDLAGLSLWPHAEGFELLRKCVEIDGAHYPETLGTHYIINAPLIFTGIWKVIKKWLDPKTAAKFEVHGTDYRAALLKAIHPSQLPVEYGGTSSFEPPPLLIDAKAARARADALAAARAAAAKEAAAFKSFFSSMLGEPPREAPPTPPATWAEAPSADEESPPPAPAPAAAPEEAAPPLRARGLSVFGAALARRRPPPPPRRPPPRRRRCRSRRRSDSRSSATATTTRAPPRPPPRPPPSRR